MESFGSIGPGSLGPFGPLGLGPWPIWAHWAWVPGPIWAHWAWVPFGPIGPRPTGIQESYRYIKILQVYKNPYRLYKNPYRYTRILPPWGLLQLIRAQRAEHKNPSKVQPMDISMDISSIYATIYVAYIQHIC